MNTSYGEAFALWFFMTLRALVVYIIVYSIYFVLKWKIGFDTTGIFSHLLKLLHFGTIIVFFVSQIYFLRKGIEEYYNRDLD